MTAPSYGSILHESIANLPSGSERLSFIPEEVEHDGIVGNRALAATHCSAVAPESWPPQTVEPPTTDAIGWKRFYLSYAGQDNQRTVIGFYGIGFWPAEKKTVQFGVALVPEYQGKQFGSEVLDAVGKWALSQPRFDSVVCDVKEDSVASIKVLERAGYQLLQEKPAPGFFRYVLAKSS